MTDPDPNKSPGFGSKEAAAQGGRARAQKLTPEELREIASKGGRAKAEKAGSKQPPRTTNPLTVNKLPQSVGGQTRGQGELFVTRELEIDGVGMGVLSDGTAFLTGRGLARLCGVSSTRISELGQNWESQSANAMAEGVKQILRDKGVHMERPYVEIKQRSGAFYAYPDVVCLAVLEYYAFDRPMDDAKRNFRILAGKALHDFIYAQVGYDPNSQVPELWRQFHDRVSLTYNSVPPGYFSVFKEIADIIVHLGQSGLHIDSKFVPDISVGLLWSKYWGSAGLADKYGERIKFEHNYPNYFPQSASNPQEPWCYPEMGLGEFKRWIREDYIKGGKFATYLEGQVEKRALPPSFAQLAIAAYTGDEPSSLPEPK